MTTPEPAPPVARYERIIRASPARIWENVRDWEHLPWLHRTTFAAIRLQSENADGWRAEVDVHSGGRSSGMLIDVRLEQASAVYRTRTLEGAGAGTEIVTGLEPVSPHATRVAVAFHIPGVAPEHAPGVGAMYRALYARLWDEDEAMMTRRQALLDGAVLAPAATTRSTLTLGPIAELRRRLPADVAAGRGRVRLVAVDDEIIAFPTVCPHRGGPLDEGEIVDGCVRCPWHGYRFDLHTGRCQDHTLRWAPVWKVRTTSAGDVVLEPAEPR